MGQVEKHLPSKYEALSSNPSNAKKKSYQRVLIIEPKHRNVCMHYVTTYHVVWMKVYIIC
jgi:hypothetical protein